MRCAADSVSVSQFRSASSEGPRLRGLWRRVLRTLLTSSAVVKRDGLNFGAFPGCVTRCFTLTSQFLLPRPTKVTIYTTWSGHFFWPFFLSSFSGVQRILGYVRPQRIVAVRPPETGRRRSIWRSLQTGTASAVLWRNWPSDAPLQDADLNWDTAVGTTRGFWLHIPSAALTVTYWSCWELKILMTCTQV